MEIPISNCPHTGKIRKVVQSLLIKEYDGNLRTHRIIDYFEADGETRSEQVAVGISRELYKQREQKGTTEGSFIDPTTQMFVEAEAPNAIPEIEFFRGIPLSSLPPTVINIGDLLDYLDQVSIQIADSNNKF